MSTQSPRFHDRHQRCEQANTLLRLISRTGRFFFRHKDNVAYMEVDERGRVWFIDYYTCRRVYTHYRGGWRGFTAGGTLQSLVRHLSRFIARGTPLPSSILGPWPADYCKGDLWGYGADMQLIRDQARELGMLPAAEGVAA